MKPRFSILTLLALTTWFALSFAALRSPPSSPISAWMIVAYIYWYVILAFFAVHASQRSSTHSIFARGALLFALIYSAAFWSRDGYFSDSSDWPLPHTCVADKLIEWTTPAVPQNLRAEINRQQCIRRLATCNVALAFGVLGGCLAVWQYRRLERREIAAQIPSSP